MEEVDFHPGNGLFSVLVNGVLRRNASTIMSQLCVQRMKNSHTYWSALWDEGLPVKITSVDQPPRSFWCQALLCFKGKNWLHCQKSISCELPCKRLRLLEIMRSFLQLEVDFLAVKSVNFCKRSHHLWKNILFIYLIVNPLAAKISLLRTQKSAKESLWKVS